MENLRYNRTSLFTKWIVSEGILTLPLVVVDVGVQGGESIRWEVFGPCVDVYGFDPLPEVVDALKEKAKDNPRRHYFCLALGDEDKETAFYVNDANTLSSSMFSQEIHRFEGNQRSERKVAATMRRLDTLLTEGTVPPPDLIKVDVEGFEKFVLQGAAQSLTSCLGAEVETGFSIGHDYPKSHFTAMQEALLKDHMLVFDLGFNRVPRGAFQDALERRRWARIDFETIGRPGTVNAFFSRDPIAERQKPESYPSPPPPMTPDHIVKAMMIFENYGLSDVAVDIATFFRTQLASRFDVDIAIDLLVRSAAHEYQFRSLRYTSLQTALSGGVADIQAAFCGGITDVRISLLNSLRFGRLSFLRKSGPRN